MITEKRREFFVRFSGSKIALLLNGIVCAIPFVFEQAFWLSWFSYLPFALFFLDKERGISAKSFFRHSFLFGYGFYFVGYSWLAELYPLEYLGIDASIALPLMIFVLAVVPGVHAVLLALSATLCHKLVERAPLGFRLAAFPCVFVLTEFGQSLGFLAFPWCRVFVTQAAVPALFQSASLFGSYFITYLVLFVNGLVAVAFWLSRYRKKAVLLAVALFSLNLAFGLVRLSLSEQAYERNADAFHAVVLQGNYPYKYKENDSVESMAKRYLFLSEQALAELNKQNENAPSERTLVLLPETAIPVTLFDSDRTYPKLFSAYAANRKISLAVGAFSYSETEEVPEEKDGRYGNSVFVFTPDGRMSAPYSKQHLVPFGEYLPCRNLFERFLPALADSAAFGTDLSPGTDNEPIDSTVGRLGIQICYESVFSRYCRAQVNNGAQVLLISTNDSTFGSSQALRHHLAQAQMRAVENNVPVLRAANTGISALIAPNGRLVQTLGADQTGYLAGTLPYGTGRTLFSYIGDAVLYLYALVLITAFAYPRLMKK